MMMIIIEKLNRMAILYEYLSSLNINVDNIFFSFKKWRHLNPLKSCLEKKLCRNIEVYFYCWVVEREIYPTNK